MTKDGWSNLPMCWDKTQEMFTHLNRIRWGYQLEMQSRMLFSTTESQFRAALIKWDVANGTRKREVLVETDDPAQIEAALLMLINQAELENKHGGNLWAF